MVSGAAGATRAALARALGVLGEPWSPALERLVEALATRLAPDAQTSDGIVPPPPAVLAPMIDRIRRDLDGSDGASVQELHLNLLANAMRRRTALTVCRAHTDLLAELSDVDAELLLALGARWPSPLLTRLELRCETLRLRAPLPRRVMIVDDRGEYTARGFRFPVSRAHTVTLERLALVAWSEHTLLPTEDPQFSRARRRAHLGTVLFREGFSRWFAGKHMTPVYDDPRFVPTEQGGIGGITLMFRTLGVTTRGRALLAAARGGGRSVDRRRQPVDQRALQQLHAVGEPVFGVVRAR